MSTITQRTPTGSWQVDRVHSFVAFEVRHSVVATFRGTFGDYDVGLSFEDGEPVVAGAVRVASVDVADDTLSGHLQSPDFFDAERHPEITFVSTAVRGAGEDVVVEGDLTIKGHTEPVVAKGSLRHVEADMSGGERYGLELEAVVDRTRFGVDWNAPLPKGGFVLADDVKLIVHLELVPER
jgi:polyisoprenoid-binding protein YceI